MMHSDNKSLPIGDLEKEGVCFCKERHRKVVKKTALLMHILSARLNFVSVNNRKQACDTSSLRAGRSSVQRLV